MAVQESPLFAIVKTHRNRWRSPGRLLSHVVDRWRQCIIGTRSSGDRDWSVRVRLPVVGGWWIKATTTDDTLDNEW